jgi:tetratricopeptide (TPR) repeat protein
MSWTILALVVPLAGPQPETPRRAAALLPTAGLQDAVLQDDVSVYHKVAAEYRTGDRRRALLEVRRWRPREIRANIGALIEEADRRHPVALRAGEVVPLPIQMDFRTVEAAALMHVEAGLLELQSFGPKRAKSQLSAATRLVEWSHKLQASRRRLLEKLRLKQDSAEEPDPARLEALAGALAIELKIGVREFYVALGAATLAIGFPETALDFAERAKEVTPDDGETLLLNACVKESLALWEVVRTDAGKARRFRGEAEALFREILAADPSQIEARLRLGRVLLTEGRPHEAEPFLEQAAEHGRDSQERYLALLLHGRASELRRNPSAAASFYRRALEAWPGSQAARLGLAHGLETSAGSPAARLLVMASLLDSRKPARELDPWWSYPFGPRGLAKVAMERLWQETLGRSFGS